MTSLDDNEDQIDDNPIGAEGVQTQDIFQQDQDYQPHPRSTPMNFQNGLAAAGNVANGVLSGIQGRQPQQPLRSRYGQPMNRVPNMSAPKGPIQSGMAPGMPGPSAPAVGPAPPAGLLGGSGASPSSGGNSNAAQASSQPQDDQRVAQINRFLGRGGPQAPQGGQPSQGAQGMVGIPPSTPGSSYVNANSGQYQAPGPQASAFDGLPEAQAGSDDGGTPGYALGGIVERPTRAILGENGPEAVVPLRPGMGGGNGVRMRPSAIPSMGRAKMKMPALPLGKRFGS